MGKFHYLKDEEGFELEKADVGFQKLRFRCCDCGLVHLFAFAIEENGNLGVAQKRLQPLTKAIRRRAGIVVRKKGKKIRE